jgi:DNA-binding response OmpR family regulator
MSDLLRDVFGRQGWHVALPSPHVDSPSVDADLILWDATEQPDASIERFARFRPHKSAPVIVLADFPRPDEIERWRQHGAAQVLAKPFYLDELLTMATALV